MSTHGDTRKAAFSAACELAAAGERPTVAAVRAKLGKGGQAAIQAGVNDWIEEAARRFQLPALPQSLQGAVIAFWDQACQTAQGQWESERTTLLGQLATCRQQCLERTQERDVLDVECGQLAGELDQSRHETAQTQAELFAAHQRLLALEHQLTATQQRLTDAQAQVKQLEQFQAVLTEQMRAVEHHAQHTTDALKRTEQEREQWQTQAQSAEQTITQLAQQMAERDREQVRLTEALAQHQAEQETQRAALTERDNQIKTLTALLERAQVTHEAESAHWLLQLDDQRQALLAAHERERRWDQERTALLEEISRLRVKPTPLKKRD